MDNNSLMNTILNKKGNINIYDLYIMVLRLLLFFNECKTTCADIFILGSEFLGLSHL